LSSRGEDARNSPVICEYGIELGLKVIFLQSLIGVAGKPDTMRSSFFTGLGLANIAWPMSSANSRR
jgi:hypothetical protein